MTDEGDTSLLRTRSDVPPEMLRALSALKAEGPSRSSLDQVAARLAAEFDAPPPVSPSGGWLLRSVGLRAVAFRVGLATLAIGATTAVWLRPNAQQKHDTAPTPAVTKAKSDPLAAAEQAPESAGADTASALGQPARHELAPASTTDGETSPAQHGELSGRARRARGRAARVVSSAAPAPSRQVSESLDRSHAALKDSNSSPTPAPLADTTANTPDAAVARAVEPPAEPPAARKLSEAELVLEARRLAVRDPNAAQRLLAQHLARFPDGVLAPEREVLAIEVLKTLGQTAAAEQRLRAFQARYPNSVHLRRLSTPSRDHR